MIKLIKNTWMLLFLVVFCYADKNKSSSRNENRFTKLHLIYKQSCIKIYYDKIWIDVLNDT